jgi:hypothetical protein
VPRVEALVEVVQGHLGSGLDLDPVLLRQRVDVPDDVLIVRAVLARPELLLQDRVILRPDAVVREDGHRRGDPAGEVVRLLDFGQVDLDRADGDLVVQLGWLGRSLPGGGGKGRDDQRDHQVHGLHGRSPWEGDVPRSRG